MCLDGNMIALLVCVHKAYPQNECQLFTFVARMNRTLEFVKQIKTR